MKKQILIVISFIMVLGCEKSDETPYCLRTNSCNVILTHNLEDSIVSELCYLTVYTEDLSEVLFADSTYTEKNEWFSFYAVPIGILNLEFIKETFNATYLTDTMILLEACQDLQLSSTITD